MKDSIKESALRALAESHGLALRHDCGGYRIVKNESYVFPDSGICPTATKRECMIFLRGYSKGQLDVAKIPML